MHRGLQLFIFAQIVFITICCLVVLNIEDENNHTLSWVQLFYNPHTKVLVPTMSLLAYFLSCLLLYCVFPTPHLNVLRFGLALALVSLVVFFCFLSSFLVCDPIVRLVRDTHFDHTPLYLLSPYDTFTYLTDTIANEKASSLLTPQSLVPQMGPGWVTEARPSFFECSSTTAYTHEGRLLIAIAMVNINTAFLLTSALAYIWKNSFHGTVHGIVLYCFVFILLINGVAAVVINESKWDWRMVVLGFFSAFASSYLSVAATHTTLPEGLVSPIPTTVRASWLLIQPILAVQSFLEKLEEDDESCFLVDNP
jgi:hypothetical protein